MKFVLSPNFELVNKQALQQYDWIDETYYSSIIGQGEDILLNIKKRVMYVINPVILQFLEGFKKPTTLKKVANGLATQAGCKVADLEDAILDFMDDMRDMGVLIKKKKLKTILKHNQQRAESRLPVGTMLADYQIVEVLAKKSKVTIYKAKNGKTAEVVVIKAQLIDPFLSPKKRRKAVKKYQQEFLLIEEVHDHPGVCGFKEFIELESGLFAVLEYVDGLALKKVLKRDNPSLSVRLLILEQFLDVMAHLHGREVIHGDLHSSNLMISTDNKVKLIDFNLSNHARPHDWEILREGGVYQYLPPEKLSDSVMEVVSGRADFRSEVFQIGVMIYLLLYGQMPFTGYRFTELRAAIRFEELILAQVTPAGEQIPDPVIKLLNRCLKKKPSKRFKSAVKLNHYFVRKFKTLQLK